jgi:hypothetical protein
MNGSMGTTCGYTLIRSDDAAARAFSCDFLLSDDGVLYARGGELTWRCFGVVDPEELLDDLGILDGTASGLVVEDVPPATVRRAGPRL